MTNESKAREIELDVYAFGEKPKGQFEAPAYRAALTMAEWKDSQIREIIDKEIDRANRYHDGNLSQFQKAASVRVVSVLCDYLGEEFPKDKFHFGFATMD